MIKRYKQKEKKNHVLNIFFAMVKQKIYNNITFAFSKVNRLKTWGFAMETNLKPEKKTICMLVAIEVQISPAK